MDQNPHALAVIAALEADGLTVGDHIAPGDSDPPYHVLYMLPGGELDGPMTAPEADADFRFQITTVGRLPDEARWHADRAAAALESEPVTVAGRFVCRIRPIEASNGVRRDDDVTPPLFYVVARYGARSFPA